MAKHSAGLLAFRFGQNKIEVLLVHPGGPFWAKKDTGAWSIPKGEYPDTEKPFAAAKREFAEETGVAAPAGDYMALADVKLSGGKIVSAWAIEADLQVEAPASNTFLIEWPPRSGHMQEFPEVDKISWFSLPVARKKIHKGQLPFLDELASKFDQANAEADLPMQTALF